MAARKKRAQAGRKRKSRGAGVAQAAGAARKAAAAREKAFRDFSAKVKKAVIAYWKERQHAKDGFWDGENPLYDGRVYTREEWLARGEDYCNESVVVIATEGPLNHLVNYGEEGDPEGLEMERFNEFVNQFGLYWELGYSWTICLDAHDSALVPGAPPVEGLPSDEVEQVADQIALAYREGQRSIMGMHDGGASNFDQPFVYIPQSPELEEALSRRGIRAHAKGRTGYYISPPGGQGTTRTHASEVIAKVLTDQGLKAHVSYAMD